jgi:MFS transporter, SP family, solute carrier family 2 (myo-inositol transporter), member 13
MTIDMSMPGSSGLLTAAGKRDMKFFSSPYVFVLTGCAGIGGFLFGYDTGIFASSFFCSSNLCSGCSNGNLGWLE